ncbi:glycosyltransferase [Weissella confusa]|uniref:glycosyltransferase n=1 Tax=Weissella confusa TaxID=1583 RepID=UPI0022E8A919|nr:glycosyltransferase [Weissella confusa]
MLHVLSFEAMVKYFLDKLTAEEPSIMYADVLEETMTQAYGSVENAEMKVAYIHADHHVAHHQILVGFRNLLRANRFDWIVTGTQTQAIDLRTEWGAQTVDIAPASVTVPDAVTDLADRRAMSVVVVTRFDRIKRVEEMIAAVVKAHKQNRDINLQLYGTVSDQAYYTQLQQQIADAHATGYITFNGATTDAIDTFQTGQVTIFTSRTEGFGRTILEAEAAGTPVISYDIDYGPRAIIGKAGKLVTDGDVNALANAIVMALADKRWREKASEAGREQARDYDAEHVQAKWLDLITKLEATHENYVD